MMGGRSIFSATALKSMRALAVVAVVLGVTSSAIAQPYPAYPVCDVKFLDSLKEKGRAEAMREVQINNSVITKPSSILALSCFDQHIRQISNGQSIFSNRYGPGGQPIGSAINTTIGGSFTSFVASNFAADLQPSVGAGTTFNSGGAYGACNRIQQLWQQVKCSTVNSTYFMSLEEFRATAAAGTDIRSPAGGAYACAAAGNMATAIYQPGVRSALDLQATRTARNGAAGYDYFNITRPNWCSTDPKEGPDPLGNSRVCTTVGGPGDQFCSSRPAIPTGAIVTYTQGMGGVAANTPMWSYDCANAGCYFDVTANANAIQYQAGQPPPNNLTCANRPY